ncbi:MAG: hypothetical protein Q9166_000274 [cf. Caloplaca sp. 2 TL-2023]
MAVPRKPLSSEPTGFIGRRYVLKSCVLEGEEAEVVLLSRHASARSVVVVEEEEEEEEEEVAMAAAAHPETRHSLVQFPYSLEGALSSPDVEAKDEPKDGDPKEGDPPEGALDSPDTEAKDDPNDGASSASERPVNDTKFCQKPTDCNHPCPDGQVPACSATWDITVRSLG